MLVIRLSALDRDDELASYKEEIRDGSNLDRLVRDLLLANSLDPFYFQVLVNGEKVNPSKWPEVTVNTKDRVLICPLLATGDNATNQGLFTTIVSVTAAILTQGLSVWAQVAINVTASIAGAQLAQQLFTIKNDAQKELEPEEKSQVYTISSQQNKVNRYGVVPKVFGTHRIFPTIAATPYTELEVEDNELIQYYYAIYDFGTGPIKAWDVKIGESPITNFSDVYIRFVGTGQRGTDFWSNKVLGYGFNLYKGSAEVLSIGASIPENEVDDGSDINNYQIIRTTGIYTGGNSREVTINFTCPGGLYSYSSAGAIGEAFIDVNVEFKLVGQSDSYYRNARNTLYVNTFKYVGGIQGGLDYDGLAVTDINTTVFPPGGAVSYSLLQSFATGKYTEYISDGSGDPAYQDTISYYGLDVGATYVIVKGNYLKFYSGMKLGLGDLPIFAQVTAVEDYLGGGQYTKLTFAALTTPVKLYTYSSSTDTYDFPSGTPIRVFYSSNYLRITGNSNAATYGMVKFTPKNSGQYVVRITRVRSGNAYSTTVQNDLTVNSIQIKTDENAILTTSSHVYLEVKLKATNQLSGTVDNLSGLVKSYLPYSYNSGATWSYVLSNNPAWVVAEILTGSINKRAISTSRLDWTSFKEWADYCDEIPPDNPLQSFGAKRYECNFVLDGKKTVRELIEQVASTAQGSLTLYNGKYGILVDKARTTPVQLFTPRNYSNFSSQRSYTEAPHGIKVKYIEPDTGWSTSELTVYNDGYTEATAETFDTTTAFACTNGEQAWRYGRYILAQNKLRREAISITVDFENLVCTRGDYVLLTQDVMKVGGYPARVTSVSGTQITINDGLSLGVGSYGYTARLATGTIVTSTLTVINSDTFDLDGAIPSVGDLIVIGLVGSITYDCIVKSIEPNGDLTATVMLVEKNDGIYESESTATIPDYNSGISEFDPEVDAPGEVENLAVIENSYNVIGNGYEYYIKISWDVPQGSSYESFFVYVNSGGGYDLQKDTKATQYTYIVDEDRLGTEHSFKVLAVSSTGNKLNLSEVGSVSANPLSKSSAPSDVENFNIDIVGETVQLFWDRIPDLDANEYLLRYSPATSSTWETSIPLLRVDKNTSLVSTHARTGTYLIKALDFNGNSSTNAGIAITTVPSLQGLNLIETIDDFPTLGGGFDVAEDITGGITIQRSVIGDADTTEYYPVKYYYFSTITDLGSIYTSRVKSQIYAEGYTEQDIMANWVTLDAVDALSSSQFGDWDVELQYRGADYITFMKDWPSLDSVSVIQGGNDDNWTAWRKFIVGDITARLIQFRLKLISNDVSISPRVYGASIQLDYPDRVVSYNNLVSTAGGYSVVYSPAFAGPSPSPVIAISIDNGQAGDYYSFTSKTLEGFTIIFYDATDTAVSRQFDVVAQGYGRKAAAII